MATSAAATSTSSDVISLVRSGVRSERSRSAARGRFVQWRPMLLAPCAVMAERTLRSRQPQHVPHAAQGVDQPRLLRIHLAAEPGHVRLDDAGVAAVVVVPDMAQDLHL